MWTKQQLCWSAKWRVCRSNIAQLAVSSGTLLASWLTACAQCKTALLSQPRVAGLQWLLAFGIIHIQGEVHGLLMLALHSCKGPTGQGQQQQLLQISGGSLGGRGGTGPIRGPTIPTTPRLLLMQAVKHAQQQLCQPGLTHLSQVAAGMQLAQHIKKMAVSDLADTKQRSQRLRGVENWQA